MTSHSTPKILLLGHTGQLGKVLKHLLTQAGTRVVTATRDGQGPAPSLDLADAESIKRCVSSLRPDIVINAAAYTAVDQAEKEPQLAGTINEDGPRTLALALKDTGALLVHYSTDYVFDGKAVQPYKPDDGVAPINVYGETKLAGEKAIRDSGVDHFILRTSMVYGASGKNFATSMFALLKKGGTLRVVDDQITSPTWAFALANFTTSLLAYSNTRGQRWLRSRCGTYHVTGRDYCSRYEFVCQMANRLSISNSHIQAVPTKEFPTPAKRPLFSVLDCTHTDDAFGIEMGSWVSHLDEVMVELTRTSV